MSTIEILINYRAAFLNGLAVTLQMASIIWSLGIVFGTALALLATRYRIEVGRPVRAFSFILGGIPMLVFLFWLHYPAQAMFDVVIDPFLTATFTFTLVNIFGVCDLVRAALDEFPAQYITAAKVSGLTRRQTIFKIQLPLIWRHVLPGLLFLQVAMLHTTLFASLISVEEIFRISQRINSQIFRPVEIYTALGIFFLAVSLPVNGLALFLKRKYGRNLSER